MRKIQLGSGGLHLPDYENYDLEVDLRRALPFPNESCSHFVLSHCLEHVTVRDAWNCLTEIHRCLCKGGKVRVAIPDVTKLWANCTPEYQSVVHRSGFGNGSKRDAIKAMIFCHGHEAAWNAALLRSVMQAVGFGCTECEVGKSEDPLLCGVEQHGHTVGQDIANQETSCVEGVK